jgi:amidophosphoribosyltransferase
MVRKRLGVNLAREHPVKADMVIPVPDGGIAASVGYAQASGIPLDNGLVRNHYVGRTFLNPVQSGRSKAVFLKHNFVKELVKGKDIVLVDDSLVRGTTMKRLVEAARKAGAKKIHLRIPCPPHKFPCFYGVDFATRGELMAAKHSIEDMEKILNVDSLRYLSIEGLLGATSIDNSNFCTACFSGEYPIKNCDQMGDKYRMEEEAGSLVEEMA